MSRVHGRSAAVVTAALLLLAGCADAPSASPAWMPSADAPAPSAASSPPPSPSPSPSPSAAPSRSSSPSPSAKSSAKAAEPQAVGTYAFPVKTGNVAYHPTHGKYPATDIFADCGSPVVAVTDGEVLEVSRKDVFVKGAPDGPNNGGLSVSILGNDGVRYYGSHLSRIAGGVDPGVRVKAGQRLGDVGRTGNANNVCHLHFGISPPCARTGDWKVRRGVIWPKPYLDTWRKNAQSTPAAKTAAWAAEHDCKA